MSRSYKRNPIVMQGPNKFTKREANRKVRKYILDIPQNGNGYKKIYESWDIKEYRRWETLRTYLKDWWMNYDTREEAIQDWKKYYRRK